MDAFVFLKIVKENSVKTQKWEDILFSMSLLYFSIYQLFQSL